MNSYPQKTYLQKSPYASPWPFPKRIKLFCWQLCWWFFCRWTPKPLKRWRLLWLKLFGATVHKNAFVHPRARITIPWNLILHEHACLGDRTHAYNLAPIEIKQRATVAQEVYLCTGTHDFDDPNLSLQTAKILVEEEAFIGLRTTVLPGVTIGARTIIGACSLVTKNQPAESICYGHPCKPHKSRKPTP